MQVALIEALLEMDTQANRASRRAKVPSTSRGEDKQR